MLESAAAVIEHTNRSSSEHRAVRAMLAANLTNEQLSEGYRIGKVGAKQGRDDMADMKTYGALSKRHKAPSGRSKISYETLKTFILFVLQAKMTRQVLYPRALNPTEPYASSDSQRLLLSKPYSPPPLLLCRWRGTA